MQQRNGQTFLSYKLTLVYNYNLEFPSKTPTYPANYYNISL